LFFTKKLFIKEKLGVTLAVTFALSTYVPLKSTKKLFTNKLGVTLAVTFALSTNVPLKSNVFVFYKKIVHKKKLGITLAVTFALTIDICSCWFNTPSLVDTFYTVSGIFVLSWIA